MIQQVKKAKQKLILSEEHKAKLRVNGWKGDRAGRSAMHKWVQLIKGKPNKCESCGATETRRYEWANIDHQYRRVLEDYIRMCRSCHRTYDIKNNNYKIGFLKIYENKKYVKSSAR